MAHWRPPGATGGATSSSISSSSGGAVGNSCSRWVSLFSVGGQHPLTVPTQILKTDIWPRHPMQFDRAAIESVQLEVAHSTFSTFALDYEFDDNLHPSRISCTIDGELAFELTIDRCADAATETMRYSDGTSYSTDFKLNCRGVELSPPNEWASCR